MAAPPDHALRAPRSEGISRRAALGALASVPSAGRAQPSTDWPRQPVHYINPFPAGGTTDALGRLYCAKMGEIAGQPFLVENRSGSGGVVGVELVAKSRPGGYTIGLSGIGTAAIAPTLYARLSYEPARDLTFVSGQWQTPMLLVANNDLPARSVPELIALLKANPG